MCNHPEVFSQWGCENPKTPGPNKQNNRGLPEVPLPERSRCGKSQRRGGVSQMHLEPSFLEYLSKMGLAVRVWEMKCHHMYNYHHKAQHGTSNVFSFCRQATGVDSPHSALSKVPTKVGLSQTYTCWRGRVAPIRTVMETVAINACVQTLGDPTKGSRS